MGKGCARRCGRPAWSCANVIIDSSTDEKCARCAARRELKFFDVIVSYNFRWFAQQMAKNSASYKRCIGDDTVGKSKICIHLFWDSTSVTFLDSFSKGLVTYFDVWNTWDTS